MDGLLDVYTTIVFFLFFVWLVYAFLYAFPSLLLLLFAKYPLFVHLDDAVHLYWIFFVVSDSPLCLLFFWNIAYLAWSCALN